VVASFLSNRDVLAAIVEPDEDNDFLQQRTRDLPKITTVLLDVVADDLRLNRDHVFEALDDRPMKIAPLVTRWQPPISSFIGILGLKRNKR
jgi:hypothetical protein